MLQTLDHLHEVVLVNVHLNDPLENIHYLTILVEKDALNV